MRWTAGLLLLILFAQAAAQDVAVTKLVVDDPIGDTEGAVPAQGAGFTDLTQATVEATNAGLHFQATVADLSMDAASGFGWEADLFFAYGDSDFLLAIQLQPTSIDVPDEADRILWGTPRANLYRFDEFVTTLASNLPAHFDPATATTNTTLPWDLVLAQDASSPSPGQPVRIVAAQVLWDATLTGGPATPGPLSVSGIGARDIAAFPEGSFLTMPGSTGAIALSTPLPIRSSNGEATTFHWPVQVVNQGSTDLAIQFDLKASDGQGLAPPGLQLAPGANATVSVYVSVPFAHEHGKTLLFPLTATAGTQKATLQLGVDYPAIAQPSGHHASLHLHGFVNHAQGQPILNGPMWMNSLEDDPAANAARLMPSSMDCPAQPPTNVPVVGDVPAIFDYGFGWSIPLRPGLAIGLDGRMGMNASLDLRLLGAAALPPGTLHARLFLDSEAFDSFGPFGNASDAFRASVPVAATAGPADVAVHLEVPLPPSMDYAPARRGENLNLGLVLCLDAPSPTGIVASFASTFAGLLLQPPVALAAGAHLVLPLDEYHDAPPVASSDGRVHLAVAQPFLRAPAGATVVWPANVHFDAQASGEYVVRLVGSGAPHAHVEGPTRLRAPTQTTVPVHFLVPDAPAGTLFEVLVDVTHGLDPSSTAGLRLSVVVDPAATNPTGAMASPDVRPAKTPLGPVALGALALALAVVRRRQ